MTITDEKGNLITVTNLKDALDQARGCVRLHEEMKEHHNPETGHYYFEDAHSHWSHILKQLEKL